MSEQYYYEPRRTQGLWYAVVYHYVNDKEVIDYKSNKYEGLGGENQAIDDVTDWMEDNEIEAEAAY